MKICAFGAGAIGGYTNGKQPDHISEAIETAAFVAAEA
jgi:hypothetical protein